MADLTKLREAILNGEADAAAAATREALAAGVPPASLVPEGVPPAMAEVGRRFDAGDYFVPELLIAARATKAVFEILRPLLASSGAAGAGRVVIGTVQGDLHDIGKNLVAAMLEGGGYEVTDLGVNVAPEKFVEVIRERKAGIVGLSALLTTTMPAMKTTIDALRTAGVRDGVKVMIGGAPVTDRYAKEIGADGCAENAGEAVALAKRLLSA